MTMFEANLLSAILTLTLLVKSIIRAQIKYHSGLLYDMPEFN